MNPCTCTVHLIDSTSSNSIHSKSLELLLSPWPDAIVSMPDAIRHLSV